MMGSNMSFCSLCTWVAALVFASLGAQRVSSAAGGALFTLPVSPALWSGVLLSAPCGFRGLNLRIGQKYGRADLESRCKGDAASPQLGLGVANELHA